jgi:hypothetical protein
MPLECSAVSLGPRSYHNQLTTAPRVPATQCRKCHHQKPTTVN